MDSYPPRRTGVQISLSLQRLSFREAFFHLELGFITTEAVKSYPRRTGACLAAGRPASQSWFKSPATLQRLLEMEVFFYAI
jgi:hypothetical protein